MNKEMYDGREISGFTVDWKNITVGNVVIEGLLDEHPSYRILTAVNETYWEYFDPSTGYYCSTSPEFCHYLVVGQKNCQGGRLMEIIYEKN